MTNPNDRHPIEPDSAENRKAALLALLVDRAKPEGPAPTLAEIGAWQSDRLDSERSDQVKSHLARDPASFAVFTELLAAQRMEMAEKPKEYLFSAIMRALGGLATRNAVWIAGAATATVLVLSVLLVLPRHNDEAGRVPLSPQFLASLPYAWPWDPQSISRGAPQTTPEQRQAFQAGLRQGLEELTQGERQWAQAIAGLATEMPDCKQAANPSECRQTRDTLNAAGRNAAGLYLACLAWEAGVQDQVPFDATYWTEQAALWQAIASKLQGRSGTDAWVRTLGAIATSGPDERGFQCQEARNLIEAGVVH